VTRYSRQELFPGIGEEGQRRIRRSRVLVVGCGALGSSLAETMTRAGVGELTVVDRDFVEESNLQRQSLFTEEDAQKSLPKAKAAEARLLKINSEVKVRGLVMDLTGENAEALLPSTDLVLDGTDNFETRFLLNDLCVREGIPWIYGACVGSYGLALLVRPKISPCLRCVLEDLPAPGSGETCDTAGVVGPIVQVIAGIQGGEALKILSGRTESLLAGIVSVDLWQGVFDVMDLRGQKPWCPACTEGRFDYLGARSSSAVLCGRDAIQIRPAPGTHLDLGTLAGRLAGLGRVILSNEYLLRFAAKEGELVVFEDGRTLVRGVSDIAAARSLFSKYVGN
jgi:molybdopterin/thiamine biosynthesis adenylyltransferase